MNWLQFSFLTILLFSIHDIALKHLAGKTDSTLASIVINISAALVLVLYLLLQPGASKLRFGAELFPSTVFWLVLAGAALGVATLTFMNAFERGGQLSIAVPVVYAGVIALCMLVGLIFFQEKLDWKQWAGAAMAVAGIFLMSGSK